MTAWLLAIWLTAPGDIFRCVSGDGSVHFQDQPCPGEQAGVLRGGSGRASETRLREWLREQGVQPASSAATRRTRSASVPAGIDLGPLPLLPTSEIALAGCSQQFLQCANRDESRMDPCVTGIPICEGGATANCCDASYLERYRLLRQRDVDGPAAVRYALLGTD